MAATTKATAVDEARSKELNQLWHKPATASLKSTLSGKDVKKLRQLVQQTFPTVDTAVWDSILPANDKEQPIVSEKYSNRALVCSRNDVPLLFDPSNGKGDVYPSIQLCWQVPNLLPPIYVHAGVPRYILRGSDLMLPGVHRQYFGKWKIGQKRAVYVQGNSQPFAVGQLIVDSDYTKQHGWVGRGMTILHTYGDALYQIAPADVPNAGFQADTIVAVEETEAVAECWDGDAEDTTDVQQTNGNGHHVAGTTNVDDATAGKNDAWSDADDAHEQQSTDQLLNKVDAIAIAEDATVGSNSSDDDDNVDTALSASNTASDVSDSDAAASTSKPARIKPPTISKDGMDQLLHQALLYALATRLNSPDLTWPLPASQLLFQYMEPASPSRTRVDFKQSSYKKLSAFLKHAHQQGLLTYKTLQSQDLVLTTVNTQHPDVTSLVIDKQYNDLVKDKEKRRQREQRKKAEAMGLVETAADKAAAEQAKRIQVVYRYRLPPPMRQHLDAAYGSQSKTHLYTVAEARELLWQYITSAGLEVERSGSLIKLSDELYAALFSGSPHRAETVSKGELAKRLEKALLAQPYYCIVQGTVQLDDLSESDFRKGHPPAIQLQVESRAGKKSMTRVEHYQPYGIDSDVLAADLRRRFASSSTVVTVPATKNKKESAMVMVQGNIVSELPDYLHQQYGVPPQRVEDATPKGKKR